MGLAPTSRTCTDPGLVSVVDAWPLQFDLPFELTPLIDRHALYLIDPEVLPLEFQSVATARNREPDDRRLQPGGGAVNP